MNPKFLFLPIVLLASCAAQPKYQDITLEGAAADAIFHEWSAALQRELSYPVDYRFDLDLTLSGIPEMDGAEMNLMVGTDASFATAWDYRFRSDLSVVSMGQELSIQLGGSSDANELRLTFDNAEIIEMMTGSGLPSGVSLSTDRMRLIWDLLMHLTEVSIEVVEEYEDFGNWMETLTGFGDFVHPMLNSRYLAMSPTLRASRWQVEGGMAHIDFGMDREMFEAMLASPEFARLGLDSTMSETIMDGIAMRASFDVLDGSMTSMRVGAEIPIENDFGEQENLSFALTMSYSPLDEIVEPIEFSDPDTAMDLNTYFDEYWPMVEAMMPMLEDYVRQEMLKSVGGDGGDFEF